jgi:hypothetical protein
MTAHRNASRGSDKAVNEDREWESRRKEYLGASLRMIGSDQTHHPAWVLAWPNEVRELPLMQDLLRGPEYLGERYRAFVNAAAWSLQAARDTDEAF